MVKICYLLFRVTWFFEDQARQERSGGNERQFQHVLMFSRTGARMSRGPWLRGWSSSLSSSVALISPL